MPGSVSQVSPMKKPFSSTVTAPPKYPRSPGMGPKSWVEEAMYATDSNSNSLLPHQVGRLCVWGWGEGVVYVTISRVCGFGRGVVCLS